MPSLAPADQADGLRRLFAAQQVRVLPIAGGIEANERAQLAGLLALALGAAGLKVAVLDQSKGLVARALGLRPRYELMHLIEGHCRFDQAAETAAHGVRILSAARGMASLAAEPDAASRLHALLDGAPARHELVIVNMEDASIAASLMPEGEGEMLILAQPSQEALTRCYMRIKTLVQHAGQRRFRLLMTGVRDARQGELAARQLCEVARRFLDVRLSVVPGEVQDGPSAQRAPEAPAYAWLAREVSGWQMKEYPSASPAARPVASIRSTSHHVHR